ncbi:MAG: hypothetical protein M1812_000767 [Candelaria pacifica]|nr:MAG: hypothetical protein M1812_000767 [Candelaria pacifica]
MRPLLRLVPLFLFDAFPAAATVNSQIGRSSGRVKVGYLGNTSVCWRCRSLQLSRQYTEGKVTSQADGESAGSHVSSSQQSIPRPDKDLKPPTSPSLEPKALPTATSSQTAKQELPSQEEGRRWHISRRFSHVMDHLQSNIFIAGQRLNDLTGYSGIEALKKEIEEQEELLRISRVSIRNYKEAYSKAITQRSASQREVNELLQRKQSWSKNDLDRFTALFTSDHANEQAESAAQEALASAERTAEEAGAKLSKSILARYHEEQIWSDKIRRMSTWGTWGLMGVNVLLFLVFQIGVEPWRRRRLVKGFEEKVMEALEREGATNSAAIAAVREESQAARIKKQDDFAQPTETPEATLDVVSEVIPATAPGNILGVAESEETTRAGSISFQPAETRPLESAASPLRTKDASHPQVPVLRSSQEFMKDLLSDRLVQLRKLDVTYIALEGAAAGAALVGLLVVLLRPK